MRKDNMSLIHFSISVHEDLNSAKYKKQLSIIGEKMETYHKGNV